MKPWKKSSIWWRVDARHFSLRYAICHKDSYCATLTSKSLMFPGKLLSYESHQRKRKKFQYFKAIKKHCFIVVSDHRSRKHELNMPIMLMFNILNDVPCTWLLQWTASHTHPEKRNGAALTHCVPQVMCNSAEKHKWKAALYRGRFSLTY